MSKKQKAWEAWDDEMNARRGIAVGFPFGIIAMTLFLGLVSITPLQQQLAECQEKLKEAQLNFEFPIARYCETNEKGDMNCTDYLQNQQPTKEEQQRVEEVQIKRFACYEICRTDYTSGTVKEYDCCLWRCDRKYSNFDFSEENNPCLEQPVRECVDWAETHTIGTLFVCTEEIASNGTCCIVDDSIQTGINKICETEEVGGKLVNCSEFCLKWNHCFCWSDEPCASEGTE